MTGRKTGRTTGRTTTRSAPLWIGGHLLLASFVGLTVMIVAVGCAPGTQESPPEPSATPDPTSTPIPPTPTPTTYRSAFVDPQANVTPYALDRYGEPENDAATLLTGCYPDLPIRPEYLDSLAKTEVQHIETTDRSTIDGIYGGWASARTIVLNLAYWEPCDIILHEVLHSLQQYWDPIDVSNFPPYVPDYVPGGEGFQRHRDNDVEWYAMYGEDKASVSVCLIEEDLRRYFPWFDYTSCATSTVLATVVVSTPTPRTSSTYWSHMSQLVARWEAFLGDWREWLGQESRYVVDGYAVEGYWDWLCGQGWYWDRLVSIKEDALAISPPASYAAFHQTLIELIDASLEVDRLHGEICKGDPSPGLIMNEDHRIAINNAIDEMSSLAQRMYELRP